MPNQDTRGITAQQLSCISMMSNSRSYTGVYEFSLFDVTVLMHSIVESWQQNWRAHYVWRWSTLCQCVSTIDSLPRFFYGIRKLHVRCFAEITAVPSTDISSIRNSGAWCRLSSLALLVRSSDSALSICSLLWKRAEDSLIMQGCRLTLNQKVSKCMQCIISYEYENPKEEKLRSIEEV